jgi:hypothetical protein
MAPKIALVDLVVINIDRLQLMYYPFNERSCQRHNPYDLVVFGCHTLVEHEGKAILY